MFIIIISLPLFILGCVLVHYAMKGDTREWAAPLIGGILLTAFSVIALSVCLVALVGVQARKDILYEQVAYEREVLVCRLDNKDENIVGNELLYKDIVEFNNDLRECKRYSKSLWVGLFFNDMCSDLEYIDITE